MGRSGVFFQEEQKDALAATVGPFSPVLPHRNGQESRLTKNIADSDCKEPRRNKFKSDIF